MFLLIATTKAQKSFIKKFFNSGKDAYVSPGNEFLYTLTGATFDFNQAANTHTTENLMVPFPCEVTKINYLTNAAQVYTNNNLAIGLVVPANNITTVANCIGGHTFAGDTAGSGDVVSGTYSSAITGSNILAANTLYEVGVVVQPTGGIVAAVTKGIQIWLRPIPNTEG